MSIGSQKVESTEQLSPMRASQLKPLKYRIGFMGDVGIGSLLEHQASEDTDNGGTDNTEANDFKAIAHGFGGDTHGLWL